MRHRYVFLVGSVVVCLMLIAGCMGDSENPTTTVVSDGPSPTPAVTATIQSAPASPATTPTLETAVSPTSPRATTTSTATLTATGEPTPTAQPLASPTPAEATSGIEEAILEPDELVTALVSGGYAIYLGVDVTDVVTSDTCDDRTALPDATQAHARAVGVAIQQLNIPVRSVISGIDCATVSAARIAFGRDPATTDLDATGDALLALLMAPAEPAANDVIVGDVAALRDLGVEVAAHESVVVEVVDAGLRLVGRLVEGDWLRLASVTNGPRFQQYAVPPGSAPHDIAPAADGGVWYTAQRSGELGWLDPVTGATRHIALGSGSAPHGVIVGPDGAPWITDSGLNAMVRVDPRTDEVTTYLLPISANANLNTAAFDGNGILWFTGQNGYYGRLDPATGEVDVWDAPRGRGPYGIDATPDGDIYYASLAGNHIARIDIDTGEATPIDPPTEGQGARRVWSDSQGRIWVSEWHSGQVSVHDPATGEWRAWRLPGPQPMTYAVYVDDRDIVWLSDFGANTLVRFDPASETFESFPLPATPSNVRQILGRPHEVWGAESAADTLVVLRVP